MKKLFDLGVRPAVALALMLMSVAEVRATLSLGDLPDMSALAPFATFGKIYIDSNVTINGDVGISEGGNLNLMAPSTINGDLYLATGATRTGPGKVTGTIFTGQDLTAAQNQVFSASATLHSLSADEDLGKVTVPGSGLTFDSKNDVADVTVVNMESLKTGGGNVAFVGDPGDYFVLNIAGDLDMGGSAALIAQSGYLLVNLWDPSRANLGVVAHVDNVINGTVLIPYDDATFHSVNGAIYSGTDSTITLMSGSRVNYVPLAPVPEPTTWIAGALLLLPLGASTLRMVRKARRF